MFKKLLVFFEKLAGRITLWAGIEVGKKDRPAWQFKILTGIEREKLIDGQEKKGK